MMRMWRKNIPKQFGCSSKTKTKTKNRITM
jgi:hypothetical protein